MAATGVPFGERRRATMSQAATEIKVQVSLHFRSADVAKLMHDRADLERRIQVYNAWLHDTDKQNEYAKYRQELKFYKEGKAPKPAKPEMPPKPKLDKQLPSEAALIRDTIKRAVEDPDIACDHP